jgi:hypothetical protein
MDMALSILVGHFVFIVFLVTSFQFVVFGDVSSVCVVVAAVVVMFNVPTLRKKVLRPLTIFFHE